jgi:hypothetical protein
MPNILTNVPRVEEFVLSEANGFMSREEVTVTLSGSAIKSGTVMSTLTASGKWVPYTGSGTTGTQTATGVLYTSQTAATGDVKAVMFVRDCEVVRAALTGLTTNAIADLAAKGILVRGKATSK